MDTHRSSDALSIGPLGRIHEFRSSAVGHGVQTMRKASRRAGSPLYEPNRFLITFDSGTSFLADPQNNGRIKQDRRHLPVLVHEYWHYLQNISTIAGVKGFLAAQNQLAIFSGSLAPDGSGNSEGSARLTSPDMNLFGEFGCLIALIEGEPGPPNRAFKTSSFEVLKAEQLDDRHELQGAQVCTGSCSAGPPTVAPPYRTGVKTGPLDSHRSARIALSVLASNPSA